MINQKERLEILEKFLWRLNYHRTITLNEKKIFEMLAINDAWVNAHDDNSGKITPAEVKKNVQAAFEKMKTLP